MIEGKRLVGVVLARTGSSRFPGKVLERLGPETVFERISDRARRVPGVDEVVLATTERARDDVLAGKGRAQGLRVFRGSENDVLGRLTSAARVARASEGDLVARINADNPFVVPPLVADAAAELVRSEAELVTPFALNALPFGAGAVVFRFEALERLEREVSSPFHREHIESRALEAPHEHPVLIQRAPRGSFLPGLSLTLDTPEDLAHLRAMDEAGIALERVPRLEDLPSELEARRALEPRFWRPRCVPAGCEPLLGFQRGRQVAGPERIEFAPPAWRALDEARRGGWLHGMDTELRASTTLAEPRSSARWFDTLRLDGQAHPLDPCTGEALPGARGIPLDAVWHAEAYHDARLSSLNRGWIASCPTATA